MHEQSNFINFDVSCPCGQWISMEPLLLTPVMAFNKLLRKSLMSFEVPHTGLQE